MMLINFPLQSVILLHLEQQLTTLSSTQGGEENGDHNNARATTSVLDSLTSYYPQQYNFLLALDLGVTIYWIKLQYSLTDLVKFTGLSPTQFQELSTEVTENKASELRLILEAFLAARLHKGLTLAEISEIKVWRLSELWRILTTKGNDYCKQRYQSQLAKLAELPLISALTSEVNELFSGITSRETSSNHPEQLPVSNKISGEFASWDLLYQELTRRFTLPIASLNSSSAANEEGLVGLDLPESQTDNTNFRLVNFALAFDSFGLSSSQNFKAVVTKLEDQAKQAWVKIPELELTAILKLSDCLHFVQPQDNVKSAAKKLKISQLLNLKQEITVQLIYPPFADKNARVRLAPQQNLLKANSTLATSINSNPETLTIDLPKSFTTNKLSAITAKDYFLQNPLAYLSQLLGAELTAWFGLQQQTVLTRYNLTTRELLSSRILDTINALSLRPELISKEVDLLAQANNSIKLAERIKDLISSDQESEQAKYATIISLESESSLNRSREGNLELVELEQNFNPVFTEEVKANRNFNAQQFQLQLEQQDKNRDQFTFNAVNLVDKFGISYKLETSKAFTIVDINQHRLGEQQVKLALQADNLSALYGLDNSSSKDYYQLRDLFQSGSRIIEESISSEANTSSTKNHPDVIQQLITGVSSLKLKETSLSSKQESLRKEIENKLVKSPQVDLALLTNLLALPQILHILELAQVKGQCLIDFISLGRNAGTVFNLAIQVLLESSNLNKFKINGNSIIREQYKQGKEQQYLTGSSILELHYPRNGVSLAEQLVNFYNFDLELKINGAELAKQGDDGKDVPNPHTHIDSSSNWLKIKQASIYTETEVVENYLCYQQAKYLAYFQNKVNRGTARIKAEDEIAWQMLNREDLYLNQQVKSHYLYSQATQLLANYLYQQRINANHDLKQEILVATANLAVIKELDNSSNYIYHSDSSNFVAITNILRSYSYLEIAELSTSLTRLGLNSFALQTLRFNFLLANEDSLEKFKLKPALSREE